AQRTREDRQGGPQTTTAAVGTNRAVEREQQEESHQRLGALDDVGDGRGLKRVDDPEQRDGSRQRDRVRAEPLGEYRALKRAPAEAIERQRGEDMDDEIASMKGVRNRWFFPRRQRVVQG